MRTYRGIAISGRQGAGKTTTIEALEAQLALESVKTKRISFADPLRRMYASTAIVKGLLPYKTVEEALASYSTWKYEHRAGLQALGEAGREIDENIWVRLAIASMKDADTVYLNDDCRYENEADALHDAGFYLVRLEVPEHVRASRVKLTGTTHSSETGLDKYEEFHHYIHTDGRLTPDEIAADILHGFHGNEDLLGPTEELADA